MEEKTKVVKTGVRHGGRAKGVMNKDTKTLRDKANALGVDPFVILLMFAKGDWQGLGYGAATRVYFTPQGLEVEEDIIKPEHRLKAASEANQYLEPKRKAIEHSGPDGKAIEISDPSKLSDTELDEKVKAMLEKMK